MFTAQRRRALLERLRDHGWVSTRELADALDVSQVTVRRDLEAMAAEGVLERMRGGARLLPVGRPVEPLTAQPADAQLNAVARVAAELIEDGDAVLLGAGPAVAALAELLVVRRGLTVVTNSVIAAEVLARAPEPVDVVLTGGSVDGDSLALVGGAAEQSLAGLHARRAFLSGAGLTPEHGLSDSELPLAAMHRAIADAAAEVVVLGPSAVVGETGLFQTVPPERVTHLVTDLDDDDPALTAFERSGTTVHVADRA